jgi:hypothetical protein
VSGSKVRGLFVNAAGSNDGWWVSDDACHVTYTCKVKVVVAQLETVPGRLLLSPVGTADDVAVAV